jgi:predicted amidohydrolase
MNVKIFKTGALGLLVGMFCSSAIAAGAEEWIFESAKLAKNAATGRILAPQTVEMRIPDEGGCGWWTVSRKIVPGGSVRFRAKAEILPDDAKDCVYNDVMMFVRWNFPKDGKDRSKSGNGVDKGAFYQRDFVGSSDRTEGAKTVRAFDETFNVPGECDSVTIEFIGKWHPMTVKISDLEITNAGKKKERKVRCVVGNPHEMTGRKKIYDLRRSGKKVSDAEVMDIQLAQMEICLTNIFANVENPDIILFSECLVTQGASDPAAVAEAIPGGPSWKLAEKYAVKHRCNIAMNVKERAEDGRCHNTVFVCDRNGKLAGRYRKVHLTSGEYQQGLVPGNGFPVFDLDFGRVGALVCWDNWFSESMKLVKRSGAELVLFPLAGCAMDHIDIAFPARAIDAGIPMLVAIRQGHLPTGIIDRDGTWIAKTFEDCGYAVADLDLEERKRTFWLSVGPGMGDPYELYFDEARPEVYEKTNWKLQRAD